MQSPSFLAHQKALEARRVNLTFDEHLLSDIDAAAAERGSSRSAFLAEAARHLMRRDCSNSHFDVSR